MRDRPPIKRYSLARAGMGQPRQEERVQRLRLVRMEEIAEMDRKRERPPPGAAGPR